MQCYGKQWRMQLGASWLVAVIQEHCQNWCMADPSSQMGPFIYLFFFSPRRGIPWEVGSGSWCLLQYPSREIEKYLPSKQRDTAILCWECPKILLGTARDTTGARVCRGLQNLQKPAPSTDMVRRKRSQSRKTIKLPNLLLYINLPTLVSLHNRYTSVPPASDLRIKQNYQTNKKTKRNETRCQSPTHLETMRSSNY